MEIRRLSREKNDLLQKGIVIPALPLALNKSLELDNNRQRALLRYYLEAGAGGVAVAVHTTQFDIRKPEVALFRPILELAIEEIMDYSKKCGKSVLGITGIVGKTSQALSEAKLAASLGYDAGLLSLAAFPGASNHELIEHCKIIASKIPLVGFYLQSAVGGRHLDVDFWREFASIDNVIAIKMAPFNRYQTLDVVRGVAESGRANEIALYTGNDDNIVPDLLTEYAIETTEGTVNKRIVGGLLGHWAVWTQKAVELLDQIQLAEKKDYHALLLQGVQVSDSNAAFFDAANNFKGVIAGIHEVLYRQGFLEGIWLLDKDEKLSPGQKKEIDRVYAAYPNLNDDIFVKQNLDKWMS